MDGNPFPNADKQPDDLARVIRSCRLSHCARACLVATRDREHALVLVETVAARENVELHQVTPAGVRRYEAATMSWRMLDSSDLSPAEMLEAAATRSGVVIMEEFVPWVADGSEHVKARLRLSELLATPRPGHGLLLAFIEAPEVESRLPALLAGQVVRLPIPYPRTTELAAMAREEIAAFIERDQRSMSVDTIRAQAALLADGLAGMTRKAARDLLQDAMTWHPTDFDAAGRYLVEHKTQRLSRELAMEVLDTNEAELPVGMENLHEHLNIQKNRMRCYGRQRARGILLVGPPGTGKTMLARAVGHLTGLPVVVFRISALMNSLLGETERLFAQAFATLEALAPCVVFIDEIEKAFGDTSERDGGTMMRVTGSLLSWLSDNPYPNYIVATCNSLTRMGEIGLTMTRSERFDAAFFVDVPNSAARTKILSQALATQLRDAAVASARLSAETEHFSGADLQSVVKQVIARCEYKGIPLTAELLSAEIHRKKSRVDALYREFDELRRWGSVYCEPADRRS